MAFLPIDFQATPVNPSVGGLYQAATLIDVPAPSRLSAGVQIRPVNCSPAHGTWNTDPCAEPVGKKSGERADPLDPFDPVLVWGYDQCDPTETVEDVRMRALQNLRLNEQEYAEFVLGERLEKDALADTGIAVLSNLVAVVSNLEGRIGNNTGFIHVSPFLAAHLATLNLITRTSGSPFLRSPLGHTYVFGAGYSDSLGTTLVATSQPYVWRDEVTVLDTLAPDENLRVAVAERHIVAGYECVYAAARFTPDAADKQFIPGVSIPGDTTPG